MPTQAAAFQRKRPVNLTLSEDVVASAKRYSNNLSATVETLLTEYTQRQQQADEDAGPDRAAGQYVHR